MCIKVPKERKITLENTGTFLHPSSSLLLAGPNADAHCPPKTHSRDKSIHNFQNSEEAPRMVRRKRCEQTSADSQLLPAQGAEVNAKEFGTSRLKVTSK